MKGLFLILIAISFNCGSATQYTMADLEVLVSEGNFQEFFQHALDIRPSERQEAWKTMVIKMADTLTKVVLQKSQNDRKDFLKIEELTTWNALKDDDVFKMRRQEIGLRYLKKCLKSDTPCWDDVKSFWEKDKNDAETAYKLAELTAGYENAPYSSWNYLEVALQSNLSEFYCKKPFVMEALWGKIEIDYVKLGPEGDLMKKIDQTLHPDCVPILISEARKRLLKPIHAHDRELSFQILKSQTKADQTTSDFFYTIYLLDNPSQGELFNYSWNRIKELGSSSLRREAVLDRIKGLDPLPDGIFSSLDETKKKVIARHFKTFFPEYFDFYALQCVNYYEGKGTFPNGNPTMHCPKLMSSEIAPILFDDFKIKRFQAVRKI